MEKLENFTKNKRFGSKQYLTSQHFRDHNGLEQNLDMYIVESIKNINFDIPDSW
jgi:hypothetical protein